MQATMHPACVLCCQAYPCNLLIHLARFDGPVIPPFHDAVDNAVSWLASDGYLAIADFFVSGKYDTPMRQMRWARRFFWR